MAGIFDSGGGDSGMTVTIRGDASGAAAAAAQAANSLSQLGPAAQEAASQASAALGQIGPAAQGAAEQADAAMSGMQGAMAGMAGTAEEAFVGTNGLAQTAQIASESLGRSLGSGPSGLMAILGNVGQGLKSTGQGFLDFGGHILNALNPMNLFTSGIGRMLEVMAGWRLMEGGIQKISEFASGVFQLPIMMEKAEGSWQYMFNPERTAGQSLADWMKQGQGISQGISDWTMKESINLPYTRQDLISAITSLAPAGLSSQGIEHYLPIIGDIAAAQNPNLNLQQAAYSVMGAMMGYSRMLRYDLHINPEQLTQYGYDQGNSATLLPALEKFAQARGLTSYDAKGTDVGAAYNISHTTFWGEWSSFIDRVQNSQIMAGDYGPFDALKHGLEWVNAWIDNHGTEIDKFAHLLGDTLAGGMTDVAKAGQGFVQGLQSSGALNSFVDAFSGLSKWVNDPTTQKNIKTLFDELGKPIGDSLRGIGTGLSAVGQGLGQAWSSLGPGGQKGLLNLLSLPGDAAAIFGPMLGGNLAALGDLGGAVGSAVHGDWGGAGQHLKHVVRDVTQPAGSIIDTVMGWGGTNTHGAGKILVNYELNHLDQVWGEAWQQMLHGGPIANAQAAAQAARGGGMGTLAGTLGHAISLAQAQAQAAYDRQYAPDTLHQDAAQARQGALRMRAMDAAAAQADRMRAETEAHAEQMRLRIGAAMAQTSDQAVRQMQTMHEGVVAHVGRTHTDAVSAMEQMRAGITAALATTTTLVMHHGKALHDGFVGQVESLSEKTTRQFKTLREQTDGILGGMANAAATWGANLVQELASGMLGKTPVAERAARDIAGALHNNLGFGSPTKEGPGATADQWAPNFMRMFNAGLLQGLPQLAQTVGQLAAAMNPLAGLGGLLGGVPSYAYNTAYGAQTTNFHLYGLEQSAVQQVVEAVLARNNDQGNRMLRRPGNYGRIGWIG